MSFLTKTLTVARAEELVKELGFLGIVDLVTFMAERMDGGMECKGPRVLVKIKVRPRVARVAAKSVKGPTVKDESGRTLGRIRGPGGKF